MDSNRLNAPRHNNVIGFWGSTALRCIHRISCLCCRNLHQLNVSGSHLEASVVTLILRMTWPFTQIPERPSTQKFQLSILVKGMQIWSQNHIVGLTLGCDMPFINQPTKQAFQRHLVHRILTARPVFRFNSNQRVPVICIRQSASYL